MKRTLVTLFFWIWAVLAGAEALTWPLRIEIKQSSSFAEYRGLRFHAGVDLKTRGETGFPVYAIADGFVSRIKVQHRGGGNNLYVDHPGVGARVVLMHLERYAEPMAAYVAAKKKKMNSRYGMDDSFSDDRFPVKKGEIIAYTGETGLGPPHLHFEMRNFRDEPVSPSAFGLIAPDTSAPEAFHLHLDPLTPEATIDGGHLPLSVPLKRGGPGRYSWSKPIRISGKVGLHVGLIDHGEGGSRFGVESLNLQVDGKLVFERKFHRFTYDQNPQCPYVYDFPKSELPGTGFVYTLFRWPFETTPFSDGFPPWAGALDLDAGRHQIRIVGSDFAGNQVVVEGTVTEEPQPAAVSLYRGSLRPLRTTYLPMALVVECQPPVSANSGACRVAVTDASGKEHLLPARFGKTTVQVAFPIDRCWEGGARAAGQEILGSHRFLDASGGEVLGPPGVRACFPPGALNLPILARWDQVRGPVPAGKSGLTELSPVWRFSPSQVIADKSVDFVLPLPKSSPAAQAGIYRFLQTGSYRYLGGDAKGSEITLTSRLPSLFILARDALPPKVVYQGQREVANLGTCYVFSVDDQGEGVNYDGAVATIAGQRAETDSDPDKDEIYILRGDGKKGKQPLVLKVPDHAGNLREIAVVR